MINDCQSELTSLVATVDRVPSAARPFNSIPATFKPSKSCPEKSRACRFVVNGTEAQRLSRDTSKDKRKALALREVPAPKAADD